MSRRAVAMLATGSAVLGGFGCLVAVAVLAPPLVALLAVVGAVLLMVAATEVV